MPHYINYVKTITKEALMYYYIYLSVTPNKKNTRYSSNINDPNTSIHTIHNPTNNNINNININNANNLSNNNFLLNPNALLDKEVIFSFNNPYMVASNRLEFNPNNGNIDNDIKKYSGIITQATYLGSTKHILSNTSQTTNILDSQDTIKDFNYMDNLVATSSQLSYRHYFNFTINSPLMRLSYNKASRIYTNITILEAIKTTLNLYTNMLSKEIDYSFIHNI